MIPLTLQEIADATSGRVAGADPGTLVSGPLSFDSRNVHPGGLFAALPGTRTDGHDFAAAAVADGAVAVLASSPVTVPAVYVQDVTAALGDIARAVADRYTGLVLALTGSAGKTSTKDLLLPVLQLAGPTVANVKSFNNEIGFPSTVARAEESTRYLVLEMGARGKGHITYLTGIARPRISAVLNVGTAHLGEFGSREGIAEAKAEIVAALPPASEGGVAVLNGDDPLVRAMAGKTAAKVLFFGTGPTCDVRAEDITLSGAGRLSFTLHAGGKSAVVSPDVFGGHHVTNALAAAALALAAGVPFETVARGLDGARIVSGARMEVTDRPDGVTVVNDAFNASPEATRAALDSLAHLAGGRPVVAVLGEMMELGDRAEEIHRNMGKLAAARGVDRLITVGGPNAAAMAAAAREAGMSEVEHVADRAGVLPLLDGLPPKAVVLVKGAHSLALDEIAATLTTSRK
ncbi:UDP-N-acetylmuramoyl-tripeptide--D-alanyl-D-alanine ligase [Streptomyces sp. NPDC059679]|uniref:UDP-N-acetylmuramoyl-tripeptide--D-alanyl-D- alanine ligase n=1 Tax=Streptomyces sp. NPDC059679 TaxID=3346903 RepID=UPI00367E124E